MNFFKKFIFAAILADAQRAKTRRILSSKFYK